MIEIGPNLMGALQILGVCSLVIFALWMALR